MCKDAFSSHPFSDIDDMLLRLHCILEKSPRMCRKLSDIILMILRRCLNSLKVVTYPCELMEVAGLRTSGKLYSELPIDTVLTLST